MKKILSLFALLVIVAAGACSKKKTPDNISDEIAFKKADELLAKMTLAEKIGQMTQIDSSVVNFTDITEYGIGSVLSGGDAMPSDIHAKGWAEYCDRVQSMALKTRLAIPIIYGIDSLHGSNKTMNAVIFPHHIGLGAANNPALVEKIARITAFESRASGFRWAFSPCVAVPLDERWGRTYEGFSEDGSITAALGAAEVRGLQDSFETNGIAACAKHFIGDGGTLHGIDQGDCVMSEKEIREKFLPAYEEAVKNGVLTVMASYSSIKGEKMHGNRYWLTDVLKNELKFKGFIISDFDALKQLGGTSKQTVEKAINAGIDMVMVPYDYKTFITNLTELVEEKKVSEERINDAVRRILYVKYKAGLFDSPYSDKDAASKVGSAEHRAVAREAVRESLVVLKNDNFFPLKKDVKKIVLCGDRASDIGSQCGGWTIDWQGSTGKVTQGTDIVTAFKNVVSKNTEVIYSKDGTDIADADKIILVLGETPYAEFKGDRTELALNPSDEDLFETIKKSGKDFAVIFISGRPMPVAEVINKSKAFVAVWLPGTEADGIADVLFGDHKPKGKLPFSWPASMKDIPINKGDGKKALFDCGYGLSW